MALNELTVHLFPGCVSSPDVAGNQDDVEDEEEGGHEGDRDNDAPREPPLNIVRLQRQGTCLFNAPREKMLDAWTCNALKYKSLLLALRSTMHV